jgi:riboflavin kinase/FMN adenylyltransferase
VLLDFDDELRHLSPGDFVERILVSGLDVAHVAVGEDFRFGYRQQGDVDLLVALGLRHGFDVAPLALVGDAQPFSATNIRAALADGDLGAVEAQLGRRFQVRGVVVRGDGRGRQIGFATANLALQPHQALPAHGVYAVRAGVGEPTLPGVANVGVRPTFDGSRLVVEVHLLDVDVDLYGSELFVDLVAHVRPERRFDGVDALVAQIALDAQTAREVLAQSADLPAS